MKPTKTFTTTTTTTASKAQQGRSTPAEQDPLVPFSTRLPKSYKRQFDTIAFELDITKQELLQRLIDAYAEQMDEH